MTVCSASADSPYCDGGMVDVFDRLAVPFQFSPPAIDLVAAVHLRAGDRVLDVGTGTGAAAMAAAAVVGPEGLVVGLDPSLVMLSRLQSKGTVRLAAGQAPDLPFRENCFDAVTASFVLSHVQRTAQALLDMVRALRPGGRLGVSNWGATSTLVSQLWTDVVNRFANGSGLQRAMQTMIPWDRWFSDEANLRIALGEAGLDAIDVSRHEYSITMDVADYMSMKQATVEGILLRRRLDGSEWRRFTQELAERFRNQFGASVTYVRDAYIAIGTKVTL